MPSAQSHGLKGKQCVLSLATQSHVARRSRLNTIRHGAVALVVLTVLLTVHLHAGEVEITILHTNDLHQHIEPLPRIAGYVAQYKREHANTVFIDAGDWFDRGSSLVLLTRGEAIYGAMARMGYDMWIVGNHDWAQRQGCRWGIQGTDAVS